MYNIILVSTDSYKGAGAVVESFSSYKEAAERAKDIAVRFKRLVKVVKVKQQQS
jgi:nucleotide-binding universal stress UspA family protein